MNQRTVLFDLGNVLVRFRPQTFAERLGLAGLSGSSRYAEPVRDLVRAYETGLLDTSRFMAELGRVFNGRFSDDQLREALHSVLDIPIPGMDELVGRVSQHASIGLVSNTNELHFEQVRKVIPALRHFSTFFLSYQLKAVKPDPAYYNAVLQLLPTPPGQIAFVDDLPENIAGAEKVGMRGMLFTDARTLERDLKLFIDF